jgi:DNA-directed RNA polymerase specialized sigma24 family protein
MRKQLKKDLKREELTRTEEAARTDEEFDELIAEWNKWDSNSERRERYHEQKLSNEMFDWDIFDRQIRRNKDFTDDFSMCVCEMHNLVADPDISRLISEATAKQKAVFFPRVIVGCSTTKIAHCHGMTDRNVRKLIDLMIDNIREELYDILIKRRETKVFIGRKQRKFLDLYKETYERKQEEKQAKKAKKEPVDKIVSE